jgi:hypothetical protein
MGKGIHLLRPIMDSDNRNINLEFTMKITRNVLESDPEVTAVMAQDILNSFSNQAIANGNKLVRVSRVFTDDKCRQRRIIEEVGIYEHC